MMNLYFFFCQYLCFFSLISFVCIFFSVQFQQTVLTELKALGRTSYTLCINSPLIIRQALHPEASKKVKFAATFCVLHKPSKSHFKSLSFYNGRILETVPVTCSPLAMHFNHLAHSECYKTFFFKCGKKLSVKLNENILHGTTSVGFHF